MPDVSNSTTRTQYSELVKGTSKFNEEGAVNYNFASVEVKGSGDIDNIGIPLMWDGSTFVAFAVNADWLASTVTALGATVKPTTQNGYEYVCIAAGTTNDSEGEPTWPTTVGATVTETDGVVWLCRIAYSGAESTLPNKANVCVLVGQSGAIGLNVTDTTLSATATVMPVLFRGEAAVAKEGFTWGSIAAVDQAEFYTAFELVGIAVTEAGDTVDPSFIA